MSGSEKSATSKHEKSRSQGQRQEETRRRGDPSPTEWVVGTVASFMVLTALGFLIFEAWSGTSLPAMVHARAGPILPMPAGGYVVEVTAANEGGTTAQGVTMEGRLHEGDSVVETRTATLQWVPAHAERSGGLFFSRDPRQYRLEVRPQGYERP